MRDRSLAMKRILIALVGTGCVIFSAARAQDRRETDPRELKVVGTELLDSAGNPVRLRGVNAACMEWTSDGEGHILSTVQTAMSDWHANVIRLPLSQDRWFGKAHGAERFRKELSHPGSPDRRRRPGQRMLYHSRPSLVRCRRVGQEHRPARHARREQHRFLEGCGGGLPESSCCLVQPVQRAAQRRLGYLEKRRPGHRKGDAEDADQDLQGRGHANAA